MRTRIHFSVFCLLAILFGSASARAQVIVLPEKPGTVVKNATNDFIYHIERISGAKLAVATTAAKPELAKEFAIRDFVEHVFHMLQRTGGLGRSVAIGFSDDDKGNVKSVSNYIRAELSKRFEGIKFVVYDTSDRTLSKGRKVCVSGQLNLPGF